MSSKPTLIFIPGGWHTAAVWDKVIRLLEAQGYTCIGVNLPSCSSNPSATFHDDIQAVRKVIISETKDKNHNVVLVAWSYGSQVACSAIKGLTPAHITPGEEQQHHGHILGLALLASGFTTTNLSFLAPTNNIPPPSITLNHTTGFAELVTDPKDLFYHDLPFPEAQYWESQLTNLSLKSLADGGEYAYAGWKEVPVWFLIPTGDRALPAEVQRGFVERAREQGGTVVVREVEAAGHAVMLSRAGEVVGFLGEALGAFVSSGTS